MHCTHKVCCIASDETLPARLCRVMLETSYKPKALKVSLVTRLSHNAYLRFLSFRSCPFFAGRRMVEVPAGLQLRKVCEEPP